MREDDRVSRPGRTGRRILLTGGRRQENRLRNDSGTAHAVHGHQAGFGMTSLRSDWFAGRAGAGRSVVLRPGGPEDVRRRSVRTTRHLIAARRVQGMTFVGRRHTDARAGHRSEGELNRQRRQNPSGQGLETSPSCVDGHVFGPASAHVPVKQIHEFLSGPRGRVTTLFDGMGRTVVQMTREENLFGSTQRRVGGRDLLHDVRAVPLFLDHAANAIDLPADAG